MVDYHIHTHLCGHATGTPEEYVNNAIKAGLLEIGFSDHAPLPLPLRKNITMEPEETEKYCTMLSELKKTSPLPVKIGFEVDFPLHPTFDTRYVTDTRIDYIIGSCHFIGDWPFDHPAFVDEYNNRDINQVYREYYSILYAMTESKLFDIIGHFDLVKKFGHRATLDLADSIEPILKLASSKSIAIEINTSGWRKPVGEVYPSYAIIQKMFSLNVPVTLGSDAHAPEEVAYNFSEAVSLLKQAGYTKIVGFNKRKQYTLPL